LSVEVREVEQAAAALAGLANEAKGRIVDSKLTQHSSGRITARQSVDVPLAALPSVLEKLRSFGAVRGQQLTRVAQAIDSPLALGRIQVDWTNEERIVRQDEGIWTHIRKGLATSFTAISWSVVVLIIGFCFVLPWVIVIYVCYLIYRRFWRRSAPI
jgi:hypothetical protein